MNAMTNVEAAACGRVASRRSALLQGKIRRQNSQEADDLRVRNLSSGGLMASCTIRFEEGEQVIVTLRAVGDVAGRIVWRDGDRIGIAFTSPIDPHAAFQPVIPQPARRFIPPVVKSERRPGLRIR